jgi:peptide/nickel transport system ATP-binding protein
MVISHGKIVESGNVEQVLVKPSHPYTQMLLASIPVPDPDARWTEKPTLALEEEGLVVVEQPDLEVLPQPRS